MAATQLDEAAQSHSGDLSRGGWLFWLTLSCWAAWLTSAAIFFAHWRLFVPPHTAWGVFSCANVGVLTLAAVSIGLRRLLVSPNRWRSLGYLLLILMPLLGFAAHVGELATNASRRNDLLIGPFDRVTFAWILSMADTEARWKFPQWVRGRHVTLVDDGQTMETQTLVAAADEHLQRMANELGKPVPNARFYWIRGEVLGRGANAMANFATCSQGNKHPTEMTSLDRHELAHTLIYMLSGPDQRPPALLEEGWAEVHSAEAAESAASRNKAVQRLAEQRRSGRAYALKTLVSPGWYNAGRGPAYDHGEPVVHYLLERFGGERFHALYSGVRRETFSADCKRILGQSWESLEENFWRWLETEDAKIAATAPEEQAGTSSLTLGEGISPKDWQELVEGYRAANPTHPAYPPFPKNTSFEMTSTVTRTPGRDGSETETKKYSSLVAAFTSDYFWAHGTGEDSEEFYWYTPSTSAHLHGENRSSLKGIVHSYDDSLRMRNYLEWNWLWSFYGGYDPASVIPGLAAGKSDKKPVLISKLVRPEDDAQPWTVEVEHDVNDVNTNEAVHYTERITVDPTNRWWISDHALEASTGATYGGRNDFKHLDSGTMPITVEQRYTWKDESGEVLTEFRHLNDEEVQSLKRNVEREVRRARWRDPLTWITATKWLSLGLIGFGVVLVAKPG